MLSPIRSNLKVLCLQVEFLASSWCPESLYNGSTGGKEQGEKGVRPLRMIVSLNYPVGNAYLVKTTDCQGNCLLPPKSHFPRLEENVSLRILVELVF